MCGSDSTRKAGVWRAGDHLNLTSGSCHWHVPQTEVELPGAPYRRRRPIAADCPRVGTNNRAQRACGPQERSSVLSRARWCCPGKLPPPTAGAASPGLAWRVQSPEGDPHAYARVCGFDKRRMPLAYALLFKRRQLACTAHSFIWQTRPSRLQTIRPYQSVPMGDRAPQKTYKGNKTLNK